MPGNSGYTFMKSTLVLGASLKPYRISHQAIHRLRSAGHEVQAVGLRDGTIADVEIRRRVEGLDEAKIDTITLYMNAGRQEPFYDWILNSGVKRVIFNPGAENFELAGLLQKKGIEAENACTLVLLSLDQY